MPTHKSAEKRLRTSKKRNIKNRQVKSKIKTVVKKFEGSPDLSALNTTISLVDKAARKRVIHKNRAARIKSRLTRLTSKKSTPAS